MTAADVTAAPREAGKAGATDAETACRAARQRLREAHAAPLFDLAVESWIPVSRSDGHLDTVSLGELLRDAHQIRDLADRHPLVRAGMRRFLQGLVVDLVRRCGAHGDQWRVLHDANTGFPPDAVAAILHAHRDYLWLWHPTSPFLQDIRLIDQLVTPSEWTPVQEIVPELPSGSSSTWFAKPGDRAVTAPVSPATVSRWLAARWFYGLPGNCGAVLVPGGQSVRSQAGGTFTELIATVTHAWRVDDRSLFRTLLRNIPRDAIAGDSAVGCAWCDSLRPSESDDPLYLATLSATATLLAARDGQGDATAMVRGPIPCDQTLLKSLRKAAVDADLHRIRVEPAPNTTTTVRPRVVRIQPSQRSETLRQVYRDGIEAIILRGVVNSADLWLGTVSRQTADREVLEMLVGEKNPIPFSPVWLEVATMYLPARYLDVEYPGIAAVRSVVAAAFDPLCGVHPRLRTATHILMDPAKPDSAAVKGLVTVAQQRWLSAAADLLRDALDGIVTPDDDWLARLWHTARDVFAETFTPYITSTRYAAPYARARSQLTMNRRMS